MNTPDPEPGALPEPSKAGAASLFRTTRWSSIRLAQADGDDQAREGLDRLAQTYWYPLYAFARRQGWIEADAQDLTQGFLARFVEGGFIRTADPSKGRFRSFLLACFKNYSADQRARSQTVKRGRDIKFVPLDTVAAEQRYREESVVLSGEEHYDRDWAQSLMSRVLDRLQNECQRTGKLDRFNQLQPFLMEDPAPSEFAQLQNQLGLGESGLRSALQRLRFRFGEYLWTEVMSTVGDHSNVENEMRYLLSILANTGPKAGEA